MGAAYLIFFTNTSVLGNQSGVYQTTNTLRSLILYQIPITSFICASDLIFSPLGTHVVLKVCSDTLHTSVWAHLEFLLLYELPIY